MPCTCSLPSVRVICWARWTSQREPFFRLGPETQHRSGTGRSASKLRRSVGRRDAACCLRRQSGCAACPSKSYAADGDAVIGAVFLDGRGTAPTSTEECNEAFCQRSANPLLLDGCARPGLTQLNANNLPSAGPVPAGPLDGYQQDRCCL